MTGYVDVTLNDLVSLLFIWLSLILTASLLVTLLPVALRQQNKIKMTECEKSLFFYQKWPFFLPYQDEVWHHSDLSHYCSHPETHKARNNIKITIVNYFLLWFPIKKKLFKSKNSRWPPEPAVSHSYGTKNFEQ